MRRGLRSASPDLTTINPAPATVAMPGPRSHGDIPLGVAARQPSERCRSIVLEVEEIARTFVGKRLNLSDIYKKASVGPAMIRFAFRAVYRRSPRRFLHDQRLRAVRAELRRAPSGATVTHIATSYGFVELGRFAAQYRAMFDENPSVTLRRALMRHAAKDIVRR